MMGSQPGVKAGDGSMEDWKEKGKWLDLQEVLRSRKQARRARARGGPGASRGAWHFPCHDGNHGRNGELTENHSSLVLWV